MCFRDLGTVDSCMVSALRPSKPYCCLLLFLALRTSPEPPGSCLAPSGGLWGPPGSLSEPLGSLLGASREHPTDFQIGICITKPSKTNKFNPNSLLCPLWFATVWPPRSKHKGKSSHRGGAGGDSPRGVFDYFYVRRRALSLAVPIAICNARPW